MFKLLRKLYDWMGAKVHSPYATWWLAGLFFIEAFFFVPVDPLLILYCVENRSRSLWYAAIATVSSVLGGITGYAIGALAWHSIGSTLVSLVISQASFDHAVETYKLYQNYAVLIAGFTPLPYKAITLSAGFCNLPLLPFVVCSFLSRGARFFLVSSLIFVFGKQIKYFIDRFFNQLVVLFTVLVVASLWLVMR